MRMRLSRVWMLLALVLVVVLGGMCRPAQAMLNPTLGRFMQQDPLGYVGSPSFYQTERTNPIRAVDASGEADTQPATTGGAATGTAPAPTYDNTFKDY